MVVDLSTADDGRPWHQALAYALTGQRWESLGVQSQPDINELIQLLRIDPGVEALSAHARATVRRGESWPHPVPAEKVIGLGYAQFAAALAQLQRALGIEPLVDAAPRVGEVSPPTAAERRLLDEVPPHHV